MTGRADTVRAWLSARRRFLGWSLFALVLVLVLPAGTFLVNRSLPFRSGPHAPAEEPGAVYSSGRPYTPKTLFTLAVGEGPRDVATRPVAEAGPPLTLEVVAPDAKGRVWVVDHPLAIRPEGRVRVFASDGRMLSAFRTPPGCTLFTPGARDDLWVDRTGAAQGRELVLRYGIDGKLLGSYVLPERFLARSLSVAPSGEAYAQSEEWLIDPQTRQPSYASSLMPVARGAELTATQGPAIAGGFIGGDGKPYVVDAVSIDTSGTTTTFRVRQGASGATYTFPPGVRPYAADAAGRVYGEAPADARGAAVGASTVGDDAGHATRIVIIDGSGVLSGVPLERPTFVGSWAPSAWPYADGGLLALSYSGAGVTVSRLTPSSAEKPVVADAARTGADIELIAPRQPVSGDPYRCDDVTTRDLARLVHAGLVSMDASLHPVPVLAEEVPTKRNGGVSADGRTVTYRLRSGVTWHDGRPVTGADVVATWEHLKRTPASGGWRPFPGFDRIAGVRADGLTVTVHLDEPFGAGPECFFPYVLPAHVLAEDAGAPNGRLHAAPIGCGPYRLERWEDGVVWQLRAHEGAAGARPRIERIDVRFLGGEEALARFQSATVPTLWMWADPASAAAVVRDRVGEIVHVATGRWFGGVFDTAAAGLDDITVRRALVAAYPLRGLAGSVVASEALAGPVDGYPAVSAAHDANAARPKTDDPARARELLGAAGWVPEAKTRHYAKAGVVAGATFQATMRGGTDELAFEHITAVTDAWQAAGLANARGLTQRRYYESWDRGGFLASQSYEFGYGVYPGFVDPGWGGMFDPEDRPGAVRPLGMSVSRDADAELARLHEQARAEYDPAARAAIAHRISARVQELALALPERYETRPVAAIGSVRGYRPGPYPAGDLWNVASWTTGGTR